MKIGELVREYRLSKKLTQQELAEKSDLSLPFINLIENNRRNLSVDALLKILFAKENFRMKIGELVREYRLSKKLTQQELAEKSDLSLPFINLIENNRRNLSVDALLKILFAMEIDPSDFFRPLSDTSDDNLQLLIEKIQLNKNRTESIELFLSILSLNEK